MRTVAIALVLIFAGSQASHSGPQLTGVPALDDYSKLTYPKYDVLDLGGGIQDALPPTIVQITEQRVVKVPQPYPVKVPVPHPVPVPVAKPYPVVETKIIKVPVHHEGGYYGQKHDGHGDGDQSQSYAAQAAWAPVQGAHEQ